MKFSKKNKILVFGIVLMLFFSYKLAIQKTIEVSNTYHSNLDKKERIKDLPKQLSFLKQKERYLDSELGSLNMDHSSIQNSLLKFLNNEADENKVKIIEFNSPHIFETDQQTKETYIFSLEGGFTNILKTIHAIENKGNFGAVIHLGLEKKKDYRTKRTFLQVKVFLEQVK